MSNANGTMDIRPGRWLYRNSRIYKVLSIDSPRMTIDVEEDRTGVRSTVPLLDLIGRRGGEMGADGQEAKTPTLVAATRGALMARIDAYVLPAAPLAVADLSEAARAKANMIVTTVKEVRRLLAAEEDRACVPREGEGGTHAAFTRVAVRKRVAFLRAILAARKKPIALPTWYKYLRLYEMANGNAERIARGMRSAAAGRTRMTPAQLHFADTMIAQFYARSDIRLPPARVYGMAEGIHQQSGGLWIDPERCGEVPDELVYELIDHTMPIEAILKNADKAALLTPITLPSWGWFRAYLRWYVNDTDHAQDVLVARYGREEFERTHMVFDTFVHRAQLPLQYVFADHYLLKVFVVDEATRTRLDRLWLTVLFDAYTRCVIGWALLYESPGIMSIQSALQNGLWPSEDLEPLGITGLWSCYGIPQMLFLDNAWAHHSHSLENLASAIGCGNEYNSMDLVFRPPYKGRYGAIIERFFGNLSRRTRDECAGAIQSRDPKAVRNAAKEACLLYGDVRTFILGEIVRYQNTRHSELGMTPNDKWAEGMAAGAPLVPPADQVARLFWRQSSDTRIITGKGICAHNMHYASPDLGRQERIGPDDKPTRYRYAFDPDNIGTLALFRARDGQYACDVEAKELRQADGTTMWMSLWELEMGRALDRGDGKQATADLVAHVNEQAALRRQRIAEQRAARRASGKADQVSILAVPAQTAAPAPHPCGRRGLAAANHTSPIATSNDYALLQERLAGFGGQASD